MIDVRICVGGGMSIFVHQGFCVLFFPSCEARQDFYIAPFRQEAIRGALHCT